MNEFYELEQERKYLPLNGPGKYRFCDKHIWTRALEIPAVEHCNLRCKWCSHSSPHMSPYEANPDEIHDNLCRLSKFLRVENIRIVGGEPLLHKDISGLLSAIKKSGICKELHLITNGILLHKFNMEDLKAIDRFEISLYPLSQSITDRIMDYAGKLSEFGKKVILNKYTHFREAVTKYHTEDITIVNMVYSTCQIVHFWRCITVTRGHLFRCPQASINLQRANTVSADALKICNISSVFELISFLESHSPLEKCKSCLGSIGLLRPHQQITSNKNTYLSECPEKAIDFDGYKLLCDNIRATVGCMIRICL